jgi:hypothetical protein
MYAVTARKPGTSADASRMGKRAAQLQIIMSGLLEIHSWNLDPYRLSRNQQGALYTFLYIVYRDMELRHGDTASNCTTTDNRSFHYVLLFQHKL